MGHYDVLIAGGGPAGCATALSLREVAPTLRVGVADAGEERHGVLGETLPPQAAVFLHHLGLQAHFDRDGHAAAFRTRSAWGWPQLVANEFLYGVHQRGWRLDRRRFDAMLKYETQQRGAVWRDGYVAGLVHEAGRWSVRFKDGHSCTADFVIDATGRGAGLCRHLGVTPQRLDRLIACVVHFPAAAAPLDMTLEAFADGWWYATTLPDGERVVACMSDNDIVRRKRLSQIEPWLRALRETGFVSAAIGDSAPRGAPQLFAANSHHQILPDELPFLAVGDAVSSFDPLSSQGVAKALRSGIFASYSAADFLLRGDARGMARYRQFVADEFAAYRDTLRDYYQRERRWSERPFWQRRHLLAGAE